MSFFFQSLLAWSHHNAHTCGTPPLRFLDRSRTKTEQNPKKNGVRFHEDSCTIMCIHGCSCAFMGIHVHSWVFMGVHGRSWVFMGVHGCSWAFMGAHGCSWVFMGVHGCSCVLCGFSCFFEYIFIFILLSKKTRAVQPRVQT